MQLSQIGLDHIAEFEGLSLRLYNDPAGHCTIGVGHLVHLGNCDGRASEFPYRSGITKAQALDLLARDAARFEDCVNTYAKRPLTQHQFDALVSLAYNVGCGGLRDSPVLRAVNQGNDPRPAWAQYALTGVGSSEILPGLVRRRKAECDLWGLASEEETDVMEYKLKFQAKPIPLTWVVAYLYGIPIWKRYLIHAQTVSKLAKELGPVEGINPTELATVPRLN